MSQLTKLQMREYMRQRRRERSTLIGSTYQELLKKNPEASKRFLDLKRWHGVG